MASPSDHGVDDLSYELGRNAEGLEQLNKLFEQHCADDDNRHLDNVKLLKANNEAIADLSKALAPLLASHALTKRRLALMASLCFSIVIILGWMLEAALKWAVDWLLKFKFG